MSTPSSLHRHRSSLDGIIDFAAEAPLGTSQRNKAHRRFYRIVEYFGAGGAIDSVPPKYEPPRLVRCTYEYALSDESRDNFLRTFFRAMALSLAEQGDDDDDDTDLDDLDHLRSLFFGFASHLLDNFFLPIKASTKKTPQPSPAYHSAVEQGQGATQGFVGTLDRLSQLRGACLVRDRHRCVVTRRFDYAEALKRTKQHGNDARDDDGAPLRAPVDLLEVAHILPQSLMKADTGGELNDSKQAALAILNMFDTGVVHLIDGTDIDRPRNAITLTGFLHTLFGDFQVYFERVPDQPSHTYRIASFLPLQLISEVTFPITRTLYVTDDKSVDPPSPRLLAVHRAIAHILHFSAAGEYIDGLLQDMDKGGVQSDGSTELDRMLRLGLGGWLNKPVY
ncbi:hypothetical protein GGR57DRAFT_507531 [Xylariaceae sp. FL1272]|nr:hypothetical protein GGR57DRAFT_507531 [Xylariaceae sp. FL1272]